MNQMRSNRIHGKVISPVYGGRTPEHTVGTWQKHGSDDWRAVFGFLPVTPSARRLAIPFDLAPDVRRKLLVVASVLVFHIALLWLLQSGLLKTVVELVVPVQMQSEFIEPLAPKVVPPPPARPLPAKPPMRVTKAPSLPPVPQPLATVGNTPAPDARVVEAAPPASVAPITPVTAPLTSPAQPLSPRLEQPSSAADYLQNPKPVYPPLSKRLGEQGQVVHSVLIGIDGLPVSARLVQSSGFERLDQAAFNAVMRWRYTPGKRNGVPAAMSFNVPINWVLE